MGIWFCPLVVYLDGRFESDHEIDFKITSWRSPTKISSEKSECRLKNMKKKIDGVIFQFMKTLI